MKKNKVLLFYVLLFLTINTLPIYGLTYTKNQPTLGLALGEGGIKGFVHIGVIKTLLENGYSIDYIAGTSIGSMVGGLFALWGDIDKVEKIALNINFEKFYKIGKNMLQLKKFGDSTYLIAYFDILNKNKNISFLSGLINSTKIRDEIDKMTNRAYMDYELKIPYKSIATDLISGKKVVIESGRLSNAIAGSICVPGLFSPLPYGDMYLVDGGLKDPVPVDIVKDMGADIVIAISLRGISTDEEIAVDNVIPIIKRSIFIMIEDLTQRSIKEADIIIAPKLKVKNLSLNINREEKLKLIKLGEEKMKEALPLLKQKIKKFKNN